MAAILALSGSYAYLRAKSIPSLVGSLALAGAYAFSGYRIQQGRYYEGHSGGVAASMVTAFILGRRAIASGLALTNPATVVAGLSVGAGVYHVNKLRREVTLRNRRH